MPLSDFFKASTRKKNMSAAKNAGRFCGQLFRTIPQFVKLRGRACAQQGHHKNDEGTVYQRLRKYLHEDEVPQAVQARCREIKIQNKYVAM